MAKFQIMSFIISIIQTLEWSIFIFKHLLDILRNFVSTGNSYLMGHPVFLFVKHGSLTYGYRQELHMQL